VKLLINFKLIPFLVIFLITTICYASPNNKSLSIPLYYDLNLGVYTADIQINNEEKLIGFVVDTGAPLTQKSNIGNILNTFDLKKEFTFLLCGKNNNLVIGNYLPQDKNKRPLINIKRTPLSLNKFYIVGLSGIEGNEGNPIVKYYPHNYAEAILDSSAGGLIVLPNDSFNVIIKYIKQYYYNFDENKGEVFILDFWHNNSCAESKLIKNNYFPDIKLSFPDYYNQNNNITITLTPDKYITSVGCDNGFKRLSFIIHDNYKKHIKHKKFLKENNPNSFILGTPIFEQYGITFNLDGDPKVKFFNKYFPCQELN